MALPCALAGTAISGYLAVTGLSAAGLPVGCGAGGGCAEVLTSRWAGVWGVPIGVPATLVWLLAIIALAARLRALLAAAALAIAFAALWFITLQVAVLHAICPWCMADHAIGLLFAVAVLVGGLARVGPLPATLGLASVGLVVLVQVVVPYRPGALGIGGAGAITVGRFELTPANAPSWGAPDAAATIVLMADYACPHCRAAHGYLNELLAAEPNRFRVLVAPVPMDHDCNRTLAMTEPRFERSCELAQLAIALWRADPARFPEFDAWLFAPETPRTPEEARAEAERLVGAEAMARALAESPLPSVIERNVDLFEAVHARRLPVILRPDGLTIEGEPASAEELDTVLRSPAKPADGSR